jgi:non-ribosomal peptide synthetase component F
MASLGFAMLDQHVVDGRADATAVRHGSETLTFARLLERAAAVGGGLSALGVQVGHEVAVDLPVGLDRVVVVCACLRLGAVPTEQPVDGAGSAVTVVEVDGTPTVTVDGQDPIDLLTLRRAGSTDPAVSLPADPDGLRPRAEQSHAGIVLPLLAGQIVETDAAQR